METQQSCSQWWGSKQCRLTRPCVHVFECISLAVMSSVAATPTPLKTRTQTHPHPPLSSPAAPTSCLSCWSQLMECRGAGRGGGAGRWAGCGGGWLDSWADAEAPPGFAEDGLFPSHPAAVQLPRHQLSWRSHQKQSRDFLSVVVGWGSGGGGAVLSHCVDQLTFYRSPQTRNLSRQNKMPGKGSVPLWPLTICSQTQYLHKLYISMWISMFIKLNYGGESD